MTQSGPTELDRVLVRLGHLGLDPIEAAAWSQVFSETGLVARLLVEDSPGAGFVSPEDVQASGLTGDDLLQRAAENLRRLTPEKPFLTIDPDAGIMVCGVLDGHDAARSLILESLLPEPFPNGVFASLPNRDSMFVLPMTVEALEKKALAVLQMLTKLAHEGAAHPLSSDLFWVQAGTWRPFEIQVAAEGPIQMRPPPELAVALVALLGAKGP